MNKVAAGYRHQAVLEYQGAEPSQPIDSSSASDCDEDWFAYKPVTGFQARPPEKKTPLRDRPM